MLFFGALASQAPVRAAEKLAIADDAAVAKPASGDEYDIAPEADAVVAKIDAQLRSGWKAHNLRPSRQATDGEWCRRVYLDLIGRTPTVEELDAFVSRRGKTKRAELVDRLLGADYAEEYARNWKTIWTNILIGRTGGTDRQSLTSRPGMMEYLEGCFVENKPYHLMVRELVTATGDARPDMDDYNGAVNFLVEKLDEGGVQAAAKTAQVFLGMSDCRSVPPVRPMRMFVQIVFQLRAKSSA